MKPLKYGSLFSGIGGFDLALEWAGMEPAWQCERDEFCLQVLAKHWPNTQRYTDVRRIRGINGPIFSRRDADWFDWPESVDVLCGGFPCQPFSIAGKRHGANDDRNLWPEMLRIVEELRPSWVIGENVNNFINLYLDVVLSDLEAAGYEGWPVVIPAAAVNAPHRRDRVFVVAHSNGGRESQQQGRIEELWHRLINSRQDVAYSISDESQYERATGQVASSQGSRESGEEQRQRVRDAAGGGGATVGNTNSQGSQGRSLHAEHSGEVSSRQAGMGHAASEGLPDWAGGEMGQPSPITEFERPSGREVERNFRGISYGVSRRVDRLKSLGNAVVPQAVYPIARLIVEIEEAIAA